MPLLTPHAVNDFKDFPIKQQIKTLIVTEIILVQKQTSKHL